jgi:hypothetical protein
MLRINGSELAARGRSNAPLGPWGSPKRGPTISQSARLW